MSSMEKIDNRFKNLIKIKNANEKIELSTEIMHLKIMNEISILMDKKFINKTLLAKKLNVSKSYITQLFTADKIINLKLLAQIQNAFDVTFNFSLNTFETNIYYIPPRTVVDATKVTIPDVTYAENAGNRFAIESQIPCEPAQVETSNPNENRMAN